MSSKIKKVLVVWLLCISLVLSTAVMGHAFSSILAVGDSLSDNGKYGQYADAAAAYTSQYDGYGFQRYSNGPVWVEYLAQYYGLSLLDMAYGGATTSLDNPAAHLSITGLQWQVAHVPAGTIDSNTLITVWAGGNDMFNSRPAVTAADNIGTAIQTLIGLGGETFVIPNLTPAGIYYDWESAFDAELAAVIANLSANNHGVDLNYLDFNNYMAIVDHYTGTWLANSCENNPGKAGCLEGTFYTWDGVHPTTQVHQQIAGWAEAEVPEPASIILLILGFAGLVGIRRRMK